MLKQFFLLFAAGSAMTAELTDTLTVPYGSGFVIQANGDAVAMTSASPDTTDLSFAVGVCPAACGATCYSAAHARRQFYILRNPADSMQLFNAPIQFASGIFDSGRTIAGGSRWECSFNSRALPQFLIIRTHEGRFALVRIRAIKLSGEDCRPLIDCCAYLPLSASITSVLQSSGLPFFTYEKTAVDRPLLRSTPIRMIAEPGPHRICDAQGRFIGNGMLSGVGVRIAGARAIRIVNIKE